MSQEPKTPHEPATPEEPYESPRLLWLEDYAPLAFGASCAKTQLQRSCRFGPIKGTP